MLELLINLIIIFVIFAAILKRMQEVAKKGRELKTPPPVIPPVPPKTIRKDMKVKPGPPQWLPAQEEKPPVEPEKPVVFGEDLWEQHPEEEFIVPATEEILQPEAELVQQIPYRGIEESVRERDIISYSDMKGSELVKGIIMSEILGPPLSLRNP